jgi:hypothetical protein
MSNTSDKNKGGRPRLETTIPEGWKEIILDAGKEGKHITDFLITLGISWEGHYALLKRNIMYSGTVQEYQKLCEQYWYNMAHTAMAEDGGQKFNSRLWSLIMRNKFGNNWSEQTSVDVTTKGQAIEKSPIQIEIIRPNDGGE